MLKVNLPAKYKPGEIKKHRTRRPCGKRKKRFIPVMAEKEFPLLSRPAETSKVDGASGCEQVWHISLTPSTQEMPIKMRRQKQCCARHARNAGESVPNGANAPLRAFMGATSSAPSHSSATNTHFQGISSFFKRIQPFSSIYGWSQCWAFCIPRGGGWIIPQRWS